MTEVSSARGGRKGSYYYYVKKAGGEERRRENFSCDMSVIGESGRKIWPECTSQKEERSASRLRSRRGRYKGLPKRKLICPSLEGPMICSDKKRSPHKFPFKEIDPQETSYNRMESRIRRLIN